MIDKQYIAYKLGSYSSEYEIALRKNIFKKMKNNENNSNITNSQTLKNIYIDFFKELIHKQKNKNKLILAAVELSVTEKCSLSCEKCFSLMPIYKQPENSTLDNLINDFNKFMSIVDYVFEFKLVGGETFLYPEIDKLIEYIFNSPYRQKFKYMNFITNGTLKLNNELLEVLEKYNENILITISDYGRISKRIIQDLDKHNINYIISDSPWIDFGEFTKNNFSKEELIKNYSYCFNKNSCNTIKDGKFHLCARDAHGYKLGLKHDSYINLHDDKSIEEKKDEINKLRNVKYIPTCDYCKLFLREITERPNIDIE